MDQEKPRGRSNLVEKNGIRPAHSRTKKNTNPILTPIQKFTKIFHYK